MSDKTYRSVHRNAPMSPRKARYVVDLVRGKPVNEALDILRFCPRRAAPMLSKVVMSALATAQLDDACDHGRLHIVDVRADDGMTLKRWKTRSRGQMYPLLLRYSHLSVVLGEREPAEPRRRRGKAVGKSRRARVEASRAAQQAAAAATATENESESGGAEASEGSE
jgi:large subunit ribosomal protein L22